MYKTRFYPFSYRRFRGSEGGLITFVMKKKPVEIVHLVTSADKCSYKAAKMPHYGGIFKNFSFEPFLRICA